MTATCPHCRATLTVTTAHPTGTIATCGDCRRAVVIQPDHLTRPPEEHAKPDDLHARIHAATRALLRERYPLRSVQAIGDAILRPSSRPVLLRLTAPTSDAPPINAALARLLEP